MTVDIPAHGSPHPPADTHEHPAGQPLAEVLAAPVLADARVLAGAAGLERRVERLNVMEVPDILPWVKPHELLLTTAYPLRAEPESLPRLVRDLDRAGLAGMGVKLGRYLDDLPEQVLEVADTLGFPLIQLPDGVGFDEILNEVLTGILNRQAQALARSERIHRAFLQLVLRGHGLPEIARDLSELTAAPTAIVGHDGELLAGARLGDVLESADGQRPRIDVAPAGVHVDGEVRAATAVPITAGTRRHGHVIAFAGADGRSGDLQALENAATVAALTLTKQLEVRAVEDKYRSDLLHDVLRSVDDEADVLRRATGFGWDLERSLTAIVLRLESPPASVAADDGPPRSRLANAVERDVIARDPGAAVVSFSHEVVVLTAAFDGAEARSDAGRFTAGMVRAAQRIVGVEVSAGLSRPIDGLHAISSGYEQASRALAVGRSVHGLGPVVHFDDLGAYRLLCLVDDADELRRFVDEVLGELAGDGEQLADLRHTLAVLLETGGNVAEAARRLHFHYNTLRYRIEKLTSMVGPFTEDARVRLDVQLALLALSMRGVGSPN